jgi:hypothetical protein
MLMCDEGDRCQVQADSDVTGCCARQKMNGCCTPHPFPTTTPLQQDCFAARSASVAVPAVSAGRVMRCRHSNVDGCVHACCPNKLVILRGMAIDIHYGLPLRRPLFCTYTCMWTMTRPAAHVLPVSTLPPRCRQFSRTSASSELLVDA